MTTIETTIVVMIKMMMIQHEIVGCKKTTAPKFSIVHASINEFGRTYVIEASSVVGASKK